MSINKNDRVLVIAGKDKGRTGTVLNVDRVSERVIVAGVNIVKKNSEAQSAAASRWNYRR
jgi:large subunit ribosomal protein L24